MPIDPFEHDSAAADDSGVLKEKLLEDPTMEPRFRIRVATLVSALFITAGLIGLLIFLICSLSEYMSKYR